MQILGFTYFCQDLASQRKCASIRDNRNGFCSCFRASSGRCQWHRERERDHFCVVRERDIYIYTCNTVLKKCEEMRCTIGVAWSWKSDRTYVLLKNRSVISHLGNDGVTKFRQSGETKVQIPRFDRSSCAILFLVSSFSSAGTRWNVYFPYCCVFCTQRLSSSYDIFGERNTKSRAV